MKHLIFVLDSLLDVMWPRSNQWEHALLGKKFQLSTGYNNIYQVASHQCNQPYVGEKKKWKESQGRKHQKSLDWGDCKPVPCRDNVNCNQVIVTQKPIPDTSSVSHQQPHKDPPEDWRRNIYSKSSVKPPRSLFISSPLVGGGDLFNLEKTMVSVLHKELEYKVEKLKCKKVRGHAAEDQNQIRTSSW